MTLRLTIILSAVFLFIAFSIGALFTTRACFMAGAGTAHPTLQQAVDRAEPGCTILLLGGTYEANVVVDKPVRIVPRAHAKPFAILGQHPTGTSAAAAFIDPASPSTLQAANADQPVVDIRSSQVEIDGLRIEGGSIGIRATGVRRVRLRDNAVERSDEAGIRLDDVRDSVVAENAISRTGVGLDARNSQQVSAIDNTLRRNDQGIRLDRASGNTLQGNRIAGSESAGLRLTAANANAIRQNAIEGNATGVMMTDSSNNALSANRLDRNDAPLRVWGPEPGHFVQRISSDNTINGRPIHYLVDAEGVTIAEASNPGYLALVDSRDVTVRDVTLPEGSQGVLVIATRDSTIEGVRIPASERGLYLRDSVQNTLRNNRIERTNGHGVTLVRSANNHLEGNVVRANDGHGVHLRQADGATLASNDVRDHPDSGVHIRASRGVHLRNNKLVSNWVGVYLEGGSGHRLERNTIAKHQFAVYVEGTDTPQFRDNRLAKNRHASNRPALLGPEASTSEN